MLFGILRQDPLSTALNTGDKNNGVFFVVLPSDAGFCFVLPVR